MIESISKESLPEAPIRPFGPDTATPSREPAIPLQQEQTVDPETLHKNTINKNDDEAPSEKNLGLYIRKNYPTWFNGLTVILHTLGAMLPFVSFIPKKISNGIKAAAIEFSRWGIPVVKIHTAWEAFQGKRLFEAIARVIPALVIPALPFFNFQLAYGLSSGVNVVLEHMTKRTGDLLKEDGFAVNNKKVIEGFTSMLKDLFQGHNIHLKERMELIVTLGGASGMIFGALSALLFARDSLNSTLARVFGSIRSIGGLFGDLSIIFFSAKTDPAERRKEKIVGPFYLIPSIMDFMQRWINQSSDANEIFNHAKTTLNTVAEVLWSSMSTDRNTRQEESYNHRVVTNILQPNSTKITPKAEAKSPERTNTNLHAAI
jgi:hypothetical protein